LKQGLRFLIALIIITLLPGCMYPDSQTRSGNITTGEYIVVVENAVQAYHKRTGVLPIHNSTIDTPIYEKYRIDFKLLRDYNLISRIPPDAFEEGGNYYYMIVNPEAEIHVKLLDLRVSQAAADLQRLIDNYKLREGRLPLGERKNAQFYQIDYKLLLMKQQQVKSVYSGQYLTYLLHESGQLAIEYAPDIMQAIQMNGNQEPDSSSDLRTLLLEQAPFIPVASYPYRWENGEPVIDTTE